MRRRWRRWMSALGMEGPLIYRNRPIDGGERLTLTSLYWDSGTDRILTTTATVGVVRTYHSTLERVKTKN